MCGIVAALRDEAPVASEQLAAAVRTIGHRGPDRSAQWISARRALVPRPHAPLDHRPRQRRPADLRRSGDVRCVVNGEFYGYRAIRERLRAEGCGFTTDSDSEIALHLYLREGDESRAPAARRVRGGDRRPSATARCSRSATASASSRSSTPCTRATCYFASEIKALLALGVPARWNREACFQECLPRSGRTSRTLFAGIYTVPPGALRDRAATARSSVYPYWDLRFSDRRRRSRPTIARDAEVVAGFRAVLDDAVRERLVADVEVASLPERRDRFLRGARPRAAPHGPADPRLHADASTTRSTTSRRSRARRPSARARASIRCRSPRARSRTPTPTPSGTPRRRS